MLEHSCKKHCIAPTWICAMGLVLELWDNFEFFADVPSHAHGHAMGMAMPMAWSPAMCMAMPSSIILNHSLFRIDGIGDAS